MDKQLPALPHSDASFDLRRRAVETPLAQRKSKRLSGEGKLGLSRKSTLQSAADADRPIRYTCLDCQPCYRCTPYPTI